MSPIRNHESGLFTDTDGRMVHELGHAFGLPDSSFTDGTPMSASFYDYPNTHFNQAQKTAIRNGPYGSFRF